MALPPRSKGPTLCLSLRLSLPLCLSTFPLGPRAPCSLPASSTSFPEASGLQTHGHQHPPQDALAPSSTLIQAHRGA